MNIVAVLGSSRSRGNSRRALDAVLGELEGRGAGVKLHELGRLSSIHPCKGCDGCRKNKKNECLQKDDLIAVIEAARRADAILVAAPVYCFGFNALTQMFFERCFYSSEGYEGGPNLLHDKRFGLVLTYGGEDEIDSGARNALGTFRDSARYVGFEIAGIVQGKTPEGLGPDRGMLAECRELAGRLLRAS